MAELYFFNLKQQTFKKVVTGLFALSLLLASVYAGFITRTYKAESISNIIQAKNSEIIAKNRRLNDRITILKGNIAGYNSQINTIQNKIAETKYTYVSQINRLENKINALNEAKNKVLTKISSIEGQFIPLTNIKSTLLTEHKESISLYFVYALIIEFGLLVLCHLLSPIINLDRLFQSGKSGNKDNDRVVIRTHSLNEPSVNHESKPLSTKDIKEKIRANMNKSSLNQDKWARQNIGISKQALHKILTGKTKTVSKPVLKKIEALS